MSGRDGYYLDTSAYLTILLGQSGHRRLSRELARGRIFSSVLLVLETTRNLIRYSREGLLPVADLRTCLSRLDRDVGAMALRDLTLDICSGTVMPVVSTPQSLDLVHLRTAVWFHEREPLARFVSLDENQVAAASELGLPV